MIRIVVVDDHPAMRLGLETVLRSEPGLVPVGSVGSAEELWPVLRRERPDLVLLDYHLPGLDGLRICRRIKDHPPSPRVLLFTAYAGGSLGIPAMLAGADGVVSKGLSALELFEVIRRVAGGDSALPATTREAYDEAALRLEVEDLPILGMLMDGTAHADVAEVLGLPGDELHHRIDAMISRLSYDVPGLHTER